jgi:hypothetical protein
MERSNGMQSVEPEGSAMTPAEREISPAPRKHAAGRKLTEWQQFFLERLDHLIELQRQSAARDEASRSLLSKAVYSTYLDCQSQGVGEEALQRIGSGGTSGAPSAN